MKFISKDGARPERLHKAMAGEGRKTLEHRGAFQISHYSSEKHKFHFTDDPTGSLGKTRCPHINCSLMRDESVSGEGVGDE